MHLQELKDRVIRVIKDEDLSLHQTINITQELFTKFHEFQSTDEKIEKLTGFVGATDLTNICKEIQELSAYRIKYGKCLDEMQEEINKLKKEVFKMINGSFGEKTKQERFYREEHRILDRQTKRYLAYVAEHEDSDFILKALNETEKSK